MQGISTNTVSLSYPSAATADTAAMDQSTLFAQLAPVRQFVNQFKVPLYVGEFSCVRWAPGLTAYHYVADSIALFEAEGYSWTYHAWRSYPGWDAELPESFFAQFPDVDAMPQGWLSADWVSARSASSDAIELLEQYFAANVH
jgi:hypothetical protein